MAVAASVAATPLFARSLLYYYDFDTVENSSLVYTVCNKGTGTAEPVLKQSGTAALGHTTGALGSDHAFYTSTVSSLWLGDGSASLGCGTQRGFTISFWCKPSLKHNAWSDFFGFCVGGRNYRFEYTTKNTPEFTMYGSGCVLSRRTEWVSAKADVWQHFAVVATPNGTNDVGTCAIYIDGVKMDDALLEAAGDLQQLHIGSWVRESEGGDRAKYANYTGIDELAVFDYPASAEQVKWLAKFKPAQPEDGPGRAMPLAYLFDTYDAAGEGVLAVNSGTGTDKAYKWKSGYANYPGAGEGALESARAFHLKGKGTFRVDGASEMNGLGATLDSGMALSFWIKAPETLYEWENFMSFRIGDRYERFEWYDSGPAHFGAYGHSTFSGEVIKLDYGKWQHVCMTWNPLNSKMEFYLDGAKAAMTVNLDNPTSADVLKSLTFGTMVFNNNGSKRNEGHETPNVYLDEIAVFNHSLSPAQIRWLVENVPALPPLDATNIVRTVSGDCAWSGGVASWRVNEWDGEAWAASGRTSLWPSCEDTETEARLVFSQGAEMTNDTFVTAKRVLLTNDTGAGSVSPKLVCAEGSMFDPATLELGEGVKLRVAAGTLAMETGSVKFNSGSSIAIDCGEVGDAWTEVLSAAAWTLPEGSQSVLDHVAPARNGWTLKVEGNSIFAKKVYGLVIVIQ